jgi:hypothetical protein
MKLSVKAIFTNLIVVALFIIASLAYFSPVLQGKAIFQSDIAQYKGMAKERNDYKETTGVESYWTNSAFGGMPTYQLGANYPHDYVKKLDRLIRFLPRPADYLFLYLIGFYILMLCMKVEYRLAVLGALAFGFSTYLIIILGVGHNAKAHALAYLPMLLGGITLVFRKKYLVGFILTAVAMALEISANHYQMTYYFMLLVLILGLVYLIYAIKDKQLKHFFTSVGILLLAVILGIATNATSLMATKEYADWSTRGKSELTIKPDGTAKEINSGLDRDYITHYSYGVTESLDLVVPRMFGGSNHEDLGKDSKAYEFLIGQGLQPSRALEFSKDLPLYWGDQPGTSAPAYIGAVLFFLFIMGLFLVKRKFVLWLLGGTILSLFLSWGKNFPALTNFMIDYFPLYNKFRAVSSIQVVLELCVPILAILGLKELFKSSTKKKAKMNALKFAGIISGGVLVLIFLMKGFFDFESFRDASMIQRGFPEDLMAMIERDREAVYVSDTIRSLVYILLTAAVLFLFIREKLKKNIVVLGLGALILFDLVGVNLRYVNNEDFVRSRAVERPFQASDLDNAIQQDKEVFRVFDPQEGLNGARTSYFHQSLGGYHAAKPGKLEDLFEYHLYDNNVAILNMLNVKYIIQQDEEGRSFPAVNDDRNGNAWFVKGLIPMQNADKEIKALDSLNTKTRAVFNFTKFSKIKKYIYEIDSLATAKLIDYRPDYLQYETVNTNDGFVVFSEMHYPKGWKSFINGKEAEHIRVNYVLRGMKVPAGNHKIEFKFEPEVVRTGSQIALGSNILLGLLILGGLLFSFWKPKRKEKKA